MPSELASDLSPLRQEVKNDQVTGTPDAMLRLQYLSRYIEAHSSHQGRNATGLASLLIFDLYPRWHKNEAAHRGGEPRIAEGA